MGAVLDILRTPLAEVLQRLSDVLSELVPHHGIAMLTGDCFQSPLRSHGDPVLAEAVTSVEMTRLADIVDIGRPWFGSAAIAGCVQPVLAAASKPTNSAGGLLAIIPVDSADPADRVIKLVQHVWDATNVHIVDLLAEAEPVYLAEQRVAASERAKVIAELSDTHSVALTSILGPLRSRSLDDATARHAATELAVSALLESRTASDRDRAGSEESITEAFARLANKLNLLTHHTDVALELVAPAQAATLPADIAHAARATVRGTALIMLEQGGVSRIRVVWQTQNNQLRVTVRDDGPGTLARDALAVHRLTDRITSLNGTLEVDAVPGWGTAVTAFLPLAAPDVPDTHPLTALNPRELDVLQELTRGHRNRQIAEHLHISEHTVKFHVANILNKLDVSSRGEAAALARDLAQISTVPDAAGIM
ncbi:LuxR C-terminal-related transcriptional regulator [Kibdelosporangium phytohabitans]|uniref:LuxR C-terminal-related transcriptional regulator n=1 Tax=Kibdelosporangium phytohabitans TaxID=860235 RepID=UPI001789ADF3|nr:DNA-binding NarL/FixJ family response regulator [Kibdelosporangium phytohabitans]